MAVGLQFDRSAEKTPATYVLDVRAECRSVLSGPKTARS